MPVHTNVMPKAKPTDSFMAWPNIDTLYDFVAYLSPDGASDLPIATLPQNLWGTEIGIVGAGVGGMVAAYELLKIGANPVIFEATDRIGGRACTVPFMDDGRPSKTDFAELGSMRFPPSGKAMFHYLEKFDLMPPADMPPFPDPGKVPTVLYYENTVYPWPAGQSAPSAFTQIAQDFNTFMDNLVRPLYTAWQQAQQNGDYGPVVQIWQNYVDQYKDVSLYTALRYGIPKWSDEDLLKFGALGVGSGGFGPLYAVNFVELLRIIVNMWEDNQILLPNGITSLVKAMYETPVTRPDGSSVSLADLDALQLKRPVVQIRVTNGQPTMYFDVPGAPARSFGAIIVATTTRAMEVMGMTLPPGEGPELVSEEVKDAVRNVHLMNSSKLFIRTATKFWKGTSMPQNIQTDELPRGVYALDYPQTEHGIVIISYVWGDDSSKLLALGKVERLHVFRQAIAKASPEFAEKLIPMNGPDDIIEVDWERTPHYYGAFKLNYPGQDPMVADLYYQFLTVLDASTDPGIYLAGDSVSWSGGWTEGAIETGLNAACAAATRIGATVRAGSPLTQSPTLYNYTNPGSSTAPKPLQTVSVR